MNAPALAVFLWALAMAETPHGVPAKPGPAGETGCWQLTPAVRTDRALELRASNQAVTDEALAAAHVRWIERELVRRGVAPVPFNVALAWNAGAARATSGRAPIASYHFAQRVLALAERRQR